MSKKEVHEEHENHERWLISYADMITLLMVLFVVLFAMATLDKTKFNALAESLSGHKAAQAAVLMGQNTVIDGGEIKKIEDTMTDQDPQMDVPELPTVFDNGAATTALRQQRQQEKAKQDEQDNLKQIQEEIQAALDAKGQGANVKFSLTKRGLTVSIVTDQVLFDPGKAALMPKSHDILNAIGPPLTHIPNEVAVEGHTDNRPIKTAQFASNWELSTARATSVLRFLVEKEGVAGTRTGATGFGAERPVASNDTEPGRSQNRRVEITVLASIQ